MGPEPKSLAVLPKYCPVSADQRAEQTRRAIVDAATRAFQLLGYSATTMGAVAALAGVSPRTLYRHYGNKSALLVATVSVGAADFLDQLAAYIQRWPLRRSILTAFTHAAIDVSEESRALLHMATTEDEVNRHWLATSQLMLPALSDSLRVAAGAEPGSNPLAWEVRAAALMSAFNVGYHHWAATPGSDLNAVITEAVDAVLPILDPGASIAETGRAAGDFGLSRPEF
jgi:AcrR family transcriptional regulator